MRNAMRCLLALVLCLLMTAGALAEPALVPQTEDWNLDGVPVDITLSVETTVHMPFDEERTAQLNALLQHVSMNIQRQMLSDEIWSRMAVRVDGGEVLALSARETMDETQLQLSVLPDRTFVQAGGQSNALNTLLGDGAADVSVFGLDGSEGAWLTDGYQMLDTAGSHLEEFKQEKSIKTAIKDMGTARLKQEYVLPKAEAAKLGEALVQACPDGMLRRLVVALSFSGQQKLYIWRDADGQLLRVEYAGKCGTDTEHLREVSFLWRMRRDSEVWDSITLKSPAVSGRDRNTVTVERVIKKGKSGAVSCKGKFVHEWVADGLKTKLSGDMDLTGTPQKDGTQLTGTVKVQQLLPDATLTESVRLTPKLLIGSDDDAPVVDGTLLVESLRGKNILEQAEIAVQVRRGEYFDWEMQENTVDLAGLTAAQTDALRQEATAAMASALIPRLALLPKEDTLYLSAGLSEDVWQTIVDAAQSALE